MDDVVPPAPVRAWIRTRDGQDHRVAATAIAASSDAALIEWEVARPLPPPGSGGPRRRDWFPAQRWDVLLNEQRTMWDL